MPLSTVKIMIKGTDFILLVEGVAIAGGRSCELQTDSELREMSSPYSTEYREFRPGWSSWSVAAGHLVMGSKVMESHVEMVGKEVEISVVCEGERLTGKAICTNWVVTGQRGALAQGSFSFLGAGELNG